MSLLLALTGGAATITGTLAVTESADVAAFTGKLEHVGTLAASETVDIVAFTGKLEHVGTFAASEVADSCAIVGTTTGEVIVQQLAAGPKKKRKSSLQQKAEIASAKERQYVVEAFKPIQFKLIESIVHVDITQQIDPTTEEIRVLIEQVQTVKRFRKLQKDDEEILLLMAA